MAAPTVAQIDERIASAERDFKKLLAELRADRRSAVARERQADRESRKRVAELVGEFVLASFPEGWRTIDPYALERALEGSCKELKPVSELSLSEARVLWRNWEKDAKARESQLPVPCETGDAKAALTEKTSPAS